MTVGETRVARLAAVLFAAGLGGAASAGAVGWEAQTPPPLPDGDVAQLRAVARAGAGTLLAAGSISPSGDGAVFASTDGTTWTLRYRGAAPAVHEFGELSMLGPSVGYVAGSFGLFLGTDDGGATWNEDLSTTVPVHRIGPDGHVYGMTAAGVGNVWTVGWDGYGAGVIYHRDPTRPDSEPHNDAYPWWLEWGAGYHAMYGVATVDGAIAWAVGAGGWIWKTTNGRDWGQQNSPTGLPLNDVVAIDANTAWAVGDGGAIVKTIDGGTTWTLQTSNTAQNLARIAAVNANVAWAVGTAGTIVHTTDGGTHWRPQVTPTDHGLSGVVASDANTAWAVGTDGAILHTVDGGVDVPWPTPQIFQVDPAHGPIAGGTAIAIDGVNFRPGATVLIGGVAATDVVVGAGNSITATTPAHAAGAVDVVVTNDDQQAATLASGFHFDGPPSVESVSPLTGRRQGGYWITVHGDGFLQGATATVGGQSVTVDFGSATDVHLFIAYTPNALWPAGADDIAIVNPDQQSVLAPAAFTFVPLTVDTLLPASGSTDGGTKVTLQGKMMGYPCPVTFGGVASTFGSLILQTLTQTVVQTPAHAAGTVDVSITCGAETLVLPGAYTFTAGPDTTTTTSATTTTATTSTSTVSATSSTTTTTLPPCTTPRCVIDGVVHGPSCTAETVPAAIVRTLGKATLAAETASGAPTKKAKRLIKRARALLRQAGAASAKAAKGKHPKLSSACATALHDASLSLAAELTP